MIKYSHQLKFPYLMEGIKANEDLGLCWVDIINKDIFLFKKPFNIINKFSYPFIVSNVFHFNEDFALVLDEIGIAEFYWKDAQIIRILNMKNKISDLGFRTNDGLMIRSNKFIFGTMDKKNPSKRKGDIWLYENHKLTNIHSYHIPNLFLKSKNRILIADSYSKIIYSHNILNFNQIDKWYDCSQDIGTPDGGCINDDKYIYVAKWGGRKVAKYDMQTRDSFFKEIDEHYPTNCAVLDNRLYITIASPPYKGGSRCESATCIIEMEIF